MTAAVAERPPLTDAEKASFIALLEERAMVAAQNKLSTFYPETGPLRRELYGKAMEFFAAGATHRQRCALMPNRSGKTEGMGGYELTLHLTGRYPPWWKGRRFRKPVRAWACGKTVEKTRDVLQVKLLGPADAMGTGLIPGDAISRVTRAPGVSEAMNTVYVKHASGAGASRLVFKSYDQGRRAYEGEEQEVIWFDEEPPLDIHTEGLLRTMTTDGIVMDTFTPLLGMSETVMYYLEDGSFEKLGDKGGGRYVIMATWDDIPHLTAAQKAELKRSIPAYQLDARTRGIPQLGSGAIYPVAEADVIVSDFHIPDHWPRAYGLDVGWNRTAAVWGARDQSSGVTYIYAEYYRGQAEPVIHATAIKSKGEWVRGAVDPASRGRSQTDGVQLFELYRQLGLRLEPADNAVEAGLGRVWDLLSTGRLKVFRSCQNWASEFRLYRRDDKGRVVKENDHLMDATRYLVTTGMGRACTAPIKNVAPVQSAVMVNRTWKR